MAVQKELDAIRFQILRALKQAFDNSAMCPERCYSEVAEEIGLPVETIIKQSEFLHITGHIEFLTNEQIQLTPKGYALISPASPFVDPSTKQDQTSVFLNPTIINVGTILML